MSEPFASAASRMAGLAARALGWRPAEFWQATPAELALSLGQAEDAVTAPSRADIAAMIEKEKRNG